MALRAAAAAAASHKTVAQKTTIGRRPHSTFTFHKIFNSKNLRSLITLWVNSFEQSTMGEHVVMSMSNLGGSCENLLLSRCFFMGLMGFNDQKH